MAEPVPSGSDVSAGTCQCTECGNTIDVQSTDHLPPCPNCGNGQWNTVSGGDSAQDPYPNNQAGVGGQIRVSCLALKWRSGSPRRAMPI